MAQQTIRRLAPPWVWALVAAGIVVGALFLPPVLVPALGISLIVGGVAGYRQSRETVVRAVAAGAIAGGVTLVLATILLGTLLLSAGSETSISEPIPMIQPMP